MQLWALRMQTSRADAPAASTPSGLAKRARRDCAHRIQHSHLARWHERASRRKGAQHKKQYIPGLSYERGVKRAHLQLRPVKALGERPRARIRAHRRAAAQRQGGVQRQRQPLLPATNASDI